MIHLFYNKGYSLNIYLSMLMVLFFSSHETFFSMVLLLFSLTEFNSIQSIFFADLDTIKIKIWLSGITVEAVID